MANEARSMVSPVQRPPSGRAAALRNGQAIAVEEVPRLEMDVFQETCFESCAAGARLLALVVLPGPSLGGDAPGDLLAVVAHDHEGRMGVFRTPVPADRAYPALTPQLPAAHVFERALFEEHGIRPVGHPWLKPLRRRGARWPHDGKETAATADFFRVEGPGIHEVAVGPVHAGIIEPGHFRFQCSGETVLHLEIRLGYQHRGARDLFLRSNPARRLAVAESIAGDTVIGHAAAYCQALEALSEVEAPLGAQATRAIALELERLANHVGDLGALCNDIGYLPGSAWLGRLRGEFLNMLLLLSGNRFGRGLVRPGGVRCELRPDLRQELLLRLLKAAADLGPTAELVFGTESVSARFEDAGIVTRATADALGLVGPAARASSSDRDVRRDHPSGLYRFAHLPVAIAETGDVMARALVRWLEAQRSLTFAQEQLDEYRSTGSRASALPASRPGRLAISLVEGWRGEIVHVAATDARGDLAVFEIFDPSVRNWFGLAMAVRGNQISDFPLCNKSFNLSYAGNDL